MMSPKENSTRCTEGRPWPVGNSGGKAKVRTQGRAALPANLARVNEAARKSRKTRFTALMHHIDVEALRRVFGWQEPYESRGSRTVLRGTGGEIPPVYPTVSNILIVDSESAISFFNRGKSIFEGLPFLQFCKK
jgi:hypothetical protein